MLLCLFSRAHLFAQSSVTLHFTNTVGTEVLMLNSAKYTNASGEPFSVNLLQYFISNIQFTTTDGKQYIVPQDSSYFFVQQDDSASQYCTVPVPAGNYTSVSFIVGIDSLRCTSKISQRKVCLIPSLTDMYWGWNSGYIFLKLEGTSSILPEDAAGLHKFRYHVGGFGGYNAPTINNIKAVQLQFSNNEVLNTNNGEPAIIEINADILKLFNGPAKLSIAEHAAVMFDPYSTTIADNYAQMFSITAIKK
jgi:hypothetical protein